MDMRNIDNYDREVTIIERKGYLNEHIHFFNLDDNEEMTVSYHFHEFNKCIIVFRGHLDYTVEGQNYAIKDNDIIIVPRKRAHKLQVKSGGYHRLIVYFSDTILSLLHTETTPIKDIMKLIGNQYPNSFVIEEYKRDELRVYERELIKECIAFGDDSLRLSYFIQWFTEYIDYLCHVDVKNPKRKLTSIDKVNQYIRTNLTDDLTIDRIANHVYLNKHYMMKQYKNIMGMSIHKFIIQERLKMVRNLMVQEMPLTEIAYEVGFKDYSTFLRAFKKQYGYSPREFMKLLPTKP